MKIAELSARSGVPIPSIKLYIREGLLPPGARTAKNQARYTAAHLDQLQLIRALRESLDMPLAQIAAVVGNRQVGGHERVRQGITAASKKKSLTTADARDREHAWESLQPVMKQLGWVSSRDASEVGETLDALVTIARGLHHTIEPSVIARYAQVAREIAEFEIPEDWDPSAAPEGALRYAVLGTLLFEPLLLSLRRLAHAERSYALSKKREAGSAHTQKPRRRRAKR